MATAAPLMPKATAVWLLDNTALSFDQIADFCKLHPLEIKAIADGDAAQGIKGLDPILTGQLTREQIAEAEKNPGRPPQADRPEGRGSLRRIAARKARVIRRFRAGRTARTPSCGWCATIRSSRTARSCASSARPSRPSPSIRDRTHWNSANLAPMDPVTLGLASQTDLDLEVQRANKEKPAPVDTGATLLPAAETTARKEAEVAAAAEPEKAGRRARRQRRVRQAQAARRQRRQRRRVTGARIFPVFSPFLRKFDAIFARKRAGK